jgi:RNA polymerase sigma-70 factor, ECF subfamily
VEAQRSVGSETDDADLVRLACAGQHAAFDLLIERYQRRATAVSYRLLGNIHDALEVCQEAFVRAYRNITTLEDPARFGAWLLRIVTNLSLNFRRSRGPRLSFEDCLGSGEDGHDDRLPPALSSTTPPGAELAGRELGDRIQTGLDALPAQQRAALVLFSVEQLPQKEVADILGCSVEAVKWHVFQARKKLKDHLAEYL